MQNLDKDKNYNPSCLYEKLKKQYGVVGSGPVYNGSLPTVASAPLYVHTPDPRYKRPAPSATPLYVHTPDPSKGVLQPQPAAPDPDFPTRYVPPRSSDGKLPLYVHTPDPSKYPSKK